MRGRANAAPAWLVVVGLSVAACSDNGGTGGRGNASGAAGTAGGAGGTGGSSGSSGNATGGVGGTSTGGTSGVSGMSGAAGGGGSSATGGLGGSSGTGAAGGMGGVAGSGGTAGTGGGAGSPPATPVCNDGWWMGTEQCDDGNTSNADMCSDTCEVRMVPVKPAQSVTSGPVPAGLQPAAAQHSAVHDAAPLSLEESRVRAAKYALWRAQQPALSLPKQRVTPLAEPTYSRHLGWGRHPIAGGSSGFAVAFVEPDTNDGNQSTVIGLRTYDTGGSATGTVDDLAVGTFAVLDANPVVAGLPSGKYAVAYTEFGGDGDELGVALRSIDSSVSPPTVGAATFANTTTDFSQRNADLLWTGSQLLAVWEDGSGAFGTDLKLRTFNESLAATSGEQTLAADVLVEEKVSLAPFDDGSTADGWVAAWRQSTGDGTESIRVVLGAGSSATTTEWSTPTFQPGAVEDRPAVAQLDSTHLVLVFTEGTDPDSVGQYDVPRLRYAVLDTASPGTLTVQTVPLDGMTSPTSASIGQDAPAALYVDGLTYVAWRTASVGASAQGEDLWVARVQLTTTADAIELPSAELSLQTSAPATVGHQRAPHLAYDAYWPSGAVAIAWEDWERFLEPMAPAAPNVGVTLRPSPITGGM